MRKAYTMVEVIFVMTVIGILGSIAIPKMSGSIDLASNNAGIDILSSVRMSIDMEKQKRILKGDFTPISSLTKNNKLVFDFFNKDGNNLSRPVLKYPIKSCKEKGCWEKANVASTTETEETYLYHYGSDEKETCEFILKKNGFFGDCPQLNSYL